MNSSEPSQSPAKVKKLIHVPAQYDDENYRRWIYDQWMAEYVAALAAYRGGSPYYGQNGGWRVD